MLSPETPSSQSKEPRAIPAHHGPRHRCRPVVDFYVNKLGMREVRRHKNDSGRYHPDLSSPSRGEKTGKDDKPPLPRAHLQLGSWRNTRRAELWPPRLRGRQYLRHLRQAAKSRRDHPPPAAATGTWPSSVRRQHSIEILQKGAALGPAEPWKSMANTGSGTPILNNFPWAPQERQAPTVIERPSITGPFCVFWLSETFDRGWRGLGLRI